MARTTRPLTNTEVKQAKPRQKEYNLADGSGLALRIKPNGSKYWIFNFARPVTKKRANISFGAYPSLSLANARNLRDEAQELLAQSIDPKEHKDEQELIQQKAHQDTLKHIAKQWLVVKKSTVSENHAQNIFDSFELHIFPALGGTPLHKLTAPKVIETFKPVEAKGSLETVKRLCQRLNEVMVWAVNTGILTANPLAGIGKAFQTPKKKHLPTIKPDQINDLMKALSAASIKLTTRCLIEWQLHTMVRPGEAASARWDDLDIDVALWTIPIGSTKTKKSDHIVPLTSQALALIEVMRPISGERDYLFPGDRQPKQHTHPSTANMALKRMGFESLLVAHGLRSLASTTLNEQGFDFDVIEAALSHLDKDEVRSAYNRTTYLERRRVLMNWWSDHIEQSANGNLSLVNSKPLRLIK